MKKWLKRIGLGFLALLVLVIASGSVFEQISRRNAAKELPPRGKLVDIGGRRIQIDCRGTGSPTLVFESGLDVAGSLAWDDVQDKIATTTRACSYSRAGIMWSDPGPSPRDGKAIAQDLHALLQKSGEHGPFVLVGHSMGGPYSVTYTQMFGGEVAGLVLVDASHPDQVPRLEAVTHRSNNIPLIVKIFGQMSWTGILRLANGTPSDNSMVAREEAAYLPQSLAARFEEADAITQTLADAGAAHTLGARPLIVLTAMSHGPQPGMSAAQIKAFEQVWQVMQDDMATWSSNSRHMLVQGSGHYIQRDKPEVVIGAVNDVVQAVRSGQRLRP